MSVATKRIILALTLAPVLLAGGCATGGGNAEETGASGSARDVLVEADLQGLDELSAHEAIRRLRPTWLRYRGQSTFTAQEGLKVYLNGSYYGEAASLSDIEVRDVQELRFLDARQATLRFGTGNTVGAIMVTSKRE